MVCPSLEMVVEFVDGQFSILAPWLDAPVSASNWPDAYWLAMKGRR